MHDHLAYTAHIEELAPRVCSNPFTDHLDDDDSPVLATHQVRFGARLIGHFWIGPKVWEKVCETCAKKIVAKWTGKDKPK